MRNDIIVLILAAGSSSRLGKPKQLEKLMGKSLIKLAVEKCIEAGFNNIHVVLGFAYEKIQKEIENYPVDILINRGWQKGMGNTLSYGLREANKKSTGDINGLLICLADQPFVSAAHLNNLYQTFIKSGKKTVTSGYNNTFGPPLICNKIFFPEILRLDNDEGAKKVLNSSDSDLITINYQPAGKDIDTPDDLTLLNT